MQRTTDRPLPDYGLDDCTAVYGAWWPLFPLRRGLLPGQLVTREQLRHVFLYFDNRFAHDMQLIFHLANTLCAAAAAHPLAGRGLSAAVSPSTLHAVVFLALWR